VTRIDDELARLRNRYANLRHEPNGQWVLIDDYPLPEGWSRPRTPLAFQIPVGYPGTPPYGFYVPSGLLFKSQRPNNYTDPAPTQPPFGGAWGIFSWSPGDGAWQPTADIDTGPNLLNWVLGFSERLREGV